MFGSIGRRRETREVRLDDEEKGARDDDASEIRF